MVSLPSPVHIGVPARVKSQIPREVRLTPKLPAKRPSSWRMRMRGTGMSPVVEAWSTCRTSRARDWPPDLLLQAKGRDAVSIVIPARNEEATVGTIVAAVRSALVHAVPLVDEVIVVDSRSADGTAA